MITEKTQVVAINEQSLWLKSTRHSSCDTCKVRAGCGQKFVQSHSGREQLIEVPADKNLLQTVQINDALDIGIDEMTLLKGSLLLYLTPLLFMVAGAFMADYLISSATDVVAVFGALFGFSLGLVVLRLHAIWSINAQKYQPVVCNLDKNPR